MADDKKASDFLNDAKALDVWRRAPTVVVVLGIGLLLLCSTCCLCGGCMGSLIRRGGSPTGTTADGNANEATKHSKVDEFLDEYERAVVKWEARADSGAFTIDDISEMSKVNIDLAEKNRQCQGEVWTSNQRKRYVDLATRFSKAMTETSKNMR